MKKKLTSDIMRRAAKVLRCISHPDRLRIVECLEGHALSVGELTGKLKLEQAVVSKHLAVLRKSGIVAGEVRGNFRYYSIAYPNVINVLDCMRRHGGKRQ